MEQLVDISSGGLSPGVFSASSAGAADEGPAGRGSGMGKARFTVILHLVLCLLTARQVLLVKMPLVVLLLAARLVLLVTMPLVCLLELSLVLAVTGLAQDRVQQRFVDAGLLDRSSWSLTLPGVWASSRPRQRRLSWLLEATSGSPRPTVGALPKKIMCGSPLGSCPLVGGKPSTWCIFRVALSLRGSSARVHCRMRPLQRVKRALVCGYVYMDCACLSVVLVLVCSLPDVGIRIRLMGKVSTWSWCSCVAMSYGGESFSPDVASDSALDSVMSMKGKYSINFFQYQDGASRCRVVVEVSLVMVPTISFGTA